MTGAIIIQTFYLMESKQYDRTTPMAAMNVSLMDKIAERRGPAACLPGHLFCLRRRLITSTRHAERHVQSVPTIDRNHGQCEPG